MPSYAIGDIQGCFQALQNLLQVIQFNPQQDKLWFTGDLVNRGPESLAVLRFIRDLNQPVIVLGNHDLHLLAVAYGQAELKPQDTFQDILQAPDCLPLCDWLRQQPLLHHDSTLGYTLVHAGLPPMWSLTQSLNHAREVEVALQGKNHLDFLANLYGDQPEQWSDGLSGLQRLRLITNYLTRLRFCDKNGKLELKTKGSSTHPSPTEFLPWFQIPNRKNKALKIIFGHWAALNGKTDDPHIYALDTGCVWGKCLTALRLEDGKRFSVPCEKFTNLPI